MNITKKVNGETMTVSIKGRLDTSTAPEFETFMNENLTEVGCLVLDCGGLEYISSAGLRVLLFAQKKMKDSLKLVNVGALIMEVFDITGFSDILTIE